MDYVDASEIMLYSLYFLAGQVVGVLAGGAVVVLGLLALVSAVKFGIKFILELIDGIAMKRDMQYWDKDDIAKYDSWRNG